METALDKAFGDAMVSYSACCKAVSSGGAAALASGPVGFTSAPSGLTKAAEQYRHYTGWTFCAVRAIAQRIAGQSVFVGRVSASPLNNAKSVKLPRCIKGVGDNVEALETHPLLDAIDDPNPLMVRWSLMVSTVSSLELTGRSFWWMPEQDGRIEIWPLPADWVQPADPMRATWLVRPKGAVEAFPVSAEEMAFFFLPNPADPFDVTSPLQSQSVAIATDESLQSSQYRQFKNGCYPGLLIRAGRLPGMIGGGEGPRPVLTQSQRNELVSAIKKVYQGSANYDEPLILDGLIEGVDRLTTSPREMDWLDSGKAVKSRIMQAYGVNSLILGEIEGANRAQAVVAEEGFASNVVNPLAEMMSQVMTQWVGPRFAAKREQLAVWIDPAVAHDIDVDLKIWDTALRYGAADRNEFRRIMMNLPEDPRFDGPMDPFSQMFLNSAAKPSMDMSEVGTREPDLIHSWKFDRVAQEAAKRNGDG